MKHPVPRGHRMPGTTPRNTRNNTDQSSNKGQPHAHVIHTAPSSTRGLLTGDGPSARSPGEYRQHAHRGSTVSTATVIIPRAVINGHHDLAHYTTRVVAGATIVAAFGEIDASNANDFGREVRCCNVIGERALVVDLSAVTFFSGQGLRALLAIGQRCADSGIPWAVIPSAVVTRILHINDTPDGAVLEARSVSAALSALLTARGGEWNGAQNWE